jgi:hypothetical protein
MRLDQKNTFLVVHRFKTKHPVIFGLKPLSRCQEAPVAMLDEVPIELDEVTDFTFMPSGRSILFKAVYKDQRGIAERVQEAHRKSPVKQPVEYIFMNDAGPALWKRFGCQQVFGIIVLHRFQRPEFAFFSF